MEPDPGNNLINLYIRLPGNFFVKSYIFTAKLKTILAIFPRIFFSEMTIYSTFCELVAVGV